MILKESIVQTPFQRLRRNRKSQSIRNTLQEVRLHPHDFTVPFFLIDGENKQEEIPNFPQIYRLSKDRIVKKALELHQKGVQAIAIFPVIDTDKKTLDAKEALNFEGMLFKAIQFIKSEIPSMVLISDIALDSYTIHGHDGILNMAGEVDNDETVAILSEMACMHAAAGSDIVAPSDMMDGRCLSIRSALDSQGFINTGILSYSIKYASGFYGPFRFAQNSKLQFGNKKSYQLNYANTKESLLEAMIDENEGADILMVKPAGFYLDIISKLNDMTCKPIAAYHVSGEYCMVMAAEEKGYLDANKAFLEILTGIKRAGAKMIFSYATEQVLPLIV